MNLFTIHNKFQYLSRAITFDFSRKLLQFGNDWHRIETTSSLLWVIPYILFTVAYKLIFRFNWIQEYAYEAIVLMQLGLNHLRMGIFVSLYICVTIRKTFKSQFENIFFEDLQENNPNQKMFLNESSLLLTSSSGSNWFST